MDFVAAMPLLAMRTCVRGLREWGNLFSQRFRFRGALAVFVVPPSKFRGRRAAHPSDHSRAALRGDVLSQAVLFRLGGYRRGVRDGGLELREPVSYALLRLLDQSFVLRRARRQRARERMRGCKQSQSYAKPRHLHSLVASLLPYTSRRCSDVSSSPLVSSDGSLVHLHLAIEHASRVRAAT